MVLDPLTALSLASNAVQFVDFGSRLVLNARAIYNSASGATAKQEEVRVLAEQFQLQCVQLVALQPLSEATGEATEDEALRILAKRCQHVAKDILVVLEDLRVDGPSRRIQSVRQAFRGSIKAPKIDELVRRMESLRGALHSALLKFLR